MKLIKQKTSPIDGKYKQIITSLSGKDYNRRSSGEEQENRWVQWSWGKNKLEDSVTCVRTKL